MAPKFGFLAALVTLSLLVGGASAQQTSLYYSLRYGHAILGSIMMIIIFPLGGIIIRLLSFKGVVYVHAGLQILGYLMFCYVFAIGIYMSYQNDYYIDPHIELGIILFGFATFQLFFGTTHHMLYRKFGRRTWVTCLHVLLGRGIITLGILNGGLGLRLSTGFPIGVIADSTELKAYGIVAGVVWVLYNVIITFGEARRLPSEDSIEGRKLGVYEPDIKS